MKKLFVIAALAFSMVSGLAFAKTEGNYVGLNILYSEITSDDIVADSVETGYDIGYGIDYKYAISLDNQFYVAPGAFFNLTDSEAEIKGGDQETDFEVSNYAGVSVDLGYDFNDKVSAFVALGWGHARTESVVKEAGVSSTENDTADFNLIGIGVKYDLGNRFNVNFGYEMLDFGLEDGDSAEVSTFKLGAAYSF